MTQKRIDNPGRVFEIVSGGHGKGVVINRVQIVVALDEGIEDAGGQCECAGANVKVVRRMLGRATASMTLDLYGHLLNVDLTGVAEALSKAIESTPGFTSVREGR